MRSRSELGLLKSEAHMWGVIHLLSSVELGSVRVVSLPLTSNTSQTFDDTTIRFFLEDTRRINALRSIPTRSKHEIL